MTRDEFGRLLELRVGKICATLDSKAKEYAAESDRLHNFKATASEFGGTPTQALWGFLLKHLTSVRDMAMGIRPITPEAVDEKVGDAINYLILLEAVFKDEMQSVKP